MKADGRDTGPPQPQASATHKPGIYILASTPSPPPPKKKNSNTVKSFEGETGNEGKKRKGKRKEEG